MGLHPLPNVTVLAGITPPGHTLLLLNVGWPLLGKPPLEADLANPGKRGLFFQHPMQYVAHT